MVTFFLSYHRKLHKNWTSLEVTCLIRPLFLCPNRWPPNTGLTTIIFSKRGWWFMFLCLKINAGWKEKIQDLIQRINSTSSFFYFYQILTPFSKLKIMSELFPYLYLQLPVQSVPIPIKIKIVSLNPADDEV